MTWKWISAPTNNQRPALRSSGTPVTPSLPVCLSPRARLSLHRCCLSVTQPIAGWCTSWWSGWTPVWRTGGRLMTRWSTGTWTEAGPWSAIHIILSSGWRRLGGPHSDRRCCSFSAGGGTHSLVAEEKVMWCDDDEFPPWRSRPLVNSHLTVLVVGGVQWLSTDHLRMIREVLNRWASRRTWTTWRHHFQLKSGLWLPWRRMLTCSVRPPQRVSQWHPGGGEVFRNGFPSSCRRDPVSQSGTEMMMMMGSSSRSSVQITVHLFLFQREIQELSRENRNIITAAKHYGYEVIDTFSITMGRYKEFLQGRCACHFHQVTANQWVRLRRVMTTWVCSPDSSPDP